MQWLATFWLFSKPLRQFSFPVQIVEEMISYKRIINRTKYTESGFRVESFWTKTFHFSIFLMAVNVVSKQVLF